MDCIGFLLRRCIQVANNSPVPSASALGAGPLGMLRTSPFVGVWMLAIWALGGQLQRLRTSNKTL